MNVARGNLRTAIEADQFDQYGDAGQLAAQTIHQIATGFHGSAGGEDIIHDQDTLAPDDRILVHLQGVLSVFQIVAH